MISLDDIVRQISRAETRRDLWRQTVDALKQDGIQRFSYHMVNAEHATITILAEGFPEAWVSEYTTSNYVAVDPIPHLASRMSRPFFWHEIGDMIDHTPEVDAFLDALDAADIGDGLALYVFGPGLLNAYVGLGFGRPNVTLTRDEIFRLQCVAQACHLRFCALTDIAREPMLSGRETEVLRWIARGKSNSVIADILGISAHTVDAHLRSIYRKLDVTDRTSAAIRGIGASLVDFPDPVGP